MSAKSAPLSQEVVVLPEPVLRSRRALRWVLLVAAIAFVGVAPATANAGGRFEWVTSGNVQIDQPVEQQTPWVDDGGPGMPWWPEDRSLWVNNPTGCIWDQDDHSALWGDGGLTAGVPVTASFCQVAEPASVHNTIWGTSGYWSFSPRILAVSVRSSSPSLDVRACYEPGGCVAIPASKAGRVYDYHGCIRLRYANNDPAIASVPGTNGALGVVTQATLSISAAKRANATGYLEAAGGFGDWSSFCSSQVATSAYPLTLYV